MDWTLVYGVIAIVVGVSILYKVTHRTPLTPEQAQLKKWAKISDDLANKNRLTLQTLMPYIHNPMWRALRRRRVINDLVWTGHAKATAAHVLAEADRIIATIEANHYALDEYGYGQWVHNPKESTQQQRIFDWVPNNGERFQALDKDTDAMLDKLDEIIVYIRSVAIEGVNASVESAKVRMQVHRQDFTSAKDADAATAKELEARPL
jgi:hypothetical protein